MKISSKCNVEKTTIVLAKNPVKKIGCQIKFFAICKSAYVIYEWYLSTETVVSWTSSDSSFSVSLWKNWATIDFRLDGVMAMVVSPWNTGSSESLSTETVLSWTYEI